MDRCWATAAELVAQRKFDEQHENARPDPSGYLPGDGAFIYASAWDDPDAEDFLRRPRPSQAAVAREKDQRGDHDE